MNSSGNGETDTHTTKVGLRRKAVHVPGAWGLGSSWQVRTRERGARQGALPCRVRTVLGPRCPRGGEVRVWARPREACAEKLGMSVVCALLGLQGRSPPLPGRPRPPRAWRADPGHEHFPPLRASHDHRPWQDHRAPTPVRGAPPATGLGLRLRGEAGPSQVSVVAPPVRRCTRGRTGAAAPKHRCTRKHWHPALPGHGTG